MKLEQWLTNHPRTSVSMLVISTVVATLAVTSPQVRSAESSNSKVSVATTGKTPDSPLIGQSMYVYIGLGQERYRFTVLDVDPRSGMICLQELPSETLAEGPSPFWVSPSLIKVMFGNKGLTEDDLKALAKKFNKSTLFGPEAFPD